MMFMIDGHNLIPKIPGLSLRDIDDENQLIEMVQEYCRIRRNRAELYFDNAPAGLAGIQQKGLLTVKFVRAGRTADQAIKDRLVSLQRSARNWTVITSDRSIQIAARTVMARWISSDEFANDLVNTLRQAAVNEKTDTNQLISDDEVIEWLKIFKEGREKPNGKFR